MSTGLRARTGDPRAIVAGGVHHLARLSDDAGVFEHADRARPRPEHGHCVDDNARAVVVLSRQTAPDPTGRLLLDRCLLFVLAAQTPDGRFRNRMDHPGHRWIDGPGTGDSWGRALWALGELSARRADHPLADRARAAFVAGARHRSDHPRAMASAALGAAAVLDHAPTLGPVTARRDTVVAAGLLVDAAAVIGRPAGDRGWIWPAPRLTYANARLPEALIAAGRSLGDQTALDDGLRLLDWLAVIERRDEVMSFTPVGGRGAGETGPAFDQQPIEAWAMAAAAARAFRATTTARWRDQVNLCHRWFDGANDSHARMRATTGGGHDGLTVLGCNANQGAESTLALIGTAQEAIDLLD